MKNPVKKSTLLGMAFAILCSGLFSFSTEMGGDSFEIYLNNKLLVSQYVARQVKTPEISLSQSKDDDQLQVYYSHCGQQGTRRLVSIKDEYNKILKEWHFPDTNGTTKNAMIVPVKEIKSLASGGGTLQLFYASTELPAGRLLTSVVKRENATSGSK